MLHEVLQHVRGHVDRVHRGKGPAKIVESVTLLPAFWFNAGRSLQPIKFLVELSPVVAPRKHRSMKPFEFTDVLKHDRMERDLDVPLGFVVLGSGEKAALLD